MSTEFKSKLKAFWNGFVAFLGWLLRDGIDGISVSAGVLFRAYDFIAGSIYMSIYGWNIATPGMKPVAAFLGIMLSWGMFFVSHKLVRGILNKEKWMSNRGFVFWFVIVILGGVAFLGDSLFIDSGWVFLAFGITEFNNPLTAGSLGIAFSKLSAMGWVFYITSAVMSGLSEFADAIFRHEGSRQVSTSTSSHIETKTESRSGRWQPIPPNVGIARIVREIKESGMLLVYGDDGQLHTVPDDDPRVIANQVRPGHIYQFEQ